MLKKSLSLLLVLFAVFTVVVLTGCSDSSSNVYYYEIDPSYTETIIMGTSADYAPYEWPMNVDGKQTLVGIDIEIAKKIAAALGKNLQIVNKSFDFLLDDLQSGKVDFVIAGMTPTEERAEVVDFSVVYYEATQVVVTTTTLASTFTSIDAINLDTVKVGAQIGSIQKDLADEYFPNAQKTYLTSVPDLMLKLEQGLIDAVVVESPVAEGYLSNVDGLQILDLTIGDPDGGSAVAVQKGDTELLATINTVLNDMMTSGEIDTIVLDMVNLNTGE